MSLTKRVFLLIICATYLVSSHGIMGVSALSDKERSLLQKNILYYDLACSTVTQPTKLDKGSGQADGAAFPALNPAAMAKAIDEYIKKANPSSALGGLGSTIVASAKNSDISPFLIISIAHEESSLADPSDFNVKKGNNAFGRTAVPSQPNFQGSRLWYKWSSMKASVDHTASENVDASGGGDIASYIRKQFNDQIDNGTLAELMNLYAPPGENDTQGYTTRIKARTAEMVELTKKNDAAQGGDTVSDKSESAPSYLLGDSISLGSKDAIEAEFKKLDREVRVNASESRSITKDGTTVGNKTSGQDAIEADIDTVKGAPVIIVALGTNQRDGNFTGSMNKMVDTLKKSNGEAQIFWVNVFSKIPDKNKINNVIDEVATDNNIEVIDAAAGSISLSGDNIHPDEDGKKRYAEVIAKAVSGDLATEKLGSSRDTTGACSCQQSTTTDPAAAGTSAAEFSPDPKAVKVYQESLKPQIDKLAPLYQRAAKEEGFKDWEILPALHHLEFNLQTTNPTTNTTFKSPYQMAQSYLGGFTGVSPSDPIFAPGKKLSDEEFVKVSRYALRYLVKNTGGKFGSEAKLKKGMTPEIAAKTIIAWKSGAGSVWFNGTLDFNKHVYAWAGYDTTALHKFPMDWPPGSPYGDEQPGHPYSRPGAATLFMILKGDSFALSAGDCSRVDDGGVDGGASAKAISGERADLAKRVLDNPNTRLGNYGNAKTQRQDIEDPSGGATDTLVIVMVGIVEQSKAKLLVNAIRRDHAPGTAHGVGKAVDIGYYGNGDSRHTAEGDRLYKYLYKNRSVLKIDQLIWQNPPAGYKCVGAGKPVDCLAFYGAGTMGQHYHHIHAGVK